jgi:hypothetical protein
MFLSDEVYALAIKPVAATEEAIKERVEDILQLCIRDVGYDGLDDDHLLASSKRANNIWNGLIDRLEKEQHPLRHILKRDGLALLMAIRSGLDIRTRSEYFNH